MLSHGLPTSWVLERGRTSLKKLLCLPTTLFIESSQQPGISVTTCVRRAYRTAREFETRAMTGRYQKTTPPDGVTPATIQSFGEQLVAKPTAPSIAVPKPADAANAPPATPVDSPVNPTANVEQGASAAAIEKAPRNRCRRSLPNQCLRTRPSSSISSRPSVHKRTTNTSKVLQRDGVRDRGTGHHLCKARSAVIKGPPDPRG